MTDSIKPPGSGRAPSSLIPASRTDATVAATRSTAAEAAGGTSGPVGPAAILAEQLKSGALSPTQVIDAVVANALDSARALGLPAAEQDRLESTLRAALVSDPTLVGLGRELER